MSKNAKLARNRLSPRSRDLF